MKKFVSNVFLSIYTFLIVIGLQFGFSEKLLAHGGEDYGESKAKTVSTEKGVVTRTAKVGDLEILLKHAPLEPDTQISGRLFVTRFATNEPAADETPMIEITAPDGKTYQAETAKTETPGSFSFKLPPLPENTYTILAKINASGKAQSAIFSGVSVEHSDSETTSSGISSWLKTALMLLGAIFFLGSFGALMFFAWRFAAREETNKEAVSV